MVEKHINDLIANISRTSLILWSLLKKYTCWKIERIVYLKATLYGRNSDSRGTFAVYFIGEKQNVECLGEKNAI